MTGIRFGSSRNSGRMALRRSQSISFLLLLLLSLIPAAASANPWSFSYAWGSELSYAGPYPYIADASLAHNESGSDFVRIGRIGVGDYIVSFRGLSVVTEDYGQLQVSALGATTNSCQTDGSVLDDVRVICYDLAGAPADARFSVLFVKHKPGTKEVAWALADQPTNPSYSPAANEAFNPTGGAISITRSGTGVYAVAFSGFGAVGIAGGHAQVSVDYNVPARCKLSSWAGDAVSVLCFDLAGAPTDVPFRVLYLRPEANRDGLGFVWLNDATSPSTTPLANWAYDSGGGPVSSTRISTGYYRVTWSGLADRGHNFGSAQASAYGTGPNWCQVFTFGSPDTADVRCFDPVGTPVDSRFSLMRYKVPKGAFNQEYAYAWANQIGGSFAPDPDSSYNAGGGGMWVNFFGGGISSVEWPGMANVGSDSGVVIVSAYNSSGGNCSIDSWDSSQADVPCFDETGSLAEIAFKILYLKPTEGTTGVAYALADEPTNSSYSAPPGFSHNPTGGALNVSRSSTGTYAVEWVGYSAIARNEGIVLTTAITTSGNRCSVGGWDALTGTVVVVCVNASGAPSDTAFSVAWLIPEEQTPGLGFAWADDPTLSPYAPFPAYSYNAGKESIQLARFGTGDYRVTFNGFEGEGAPGHRGHVQVTQYEAFGSPSGYCRSRDFTQERASLSCVNHSGVDSDEVYDVLMLRPVRLPEPGTALGLVVGIACPGCMARFGGRH